MTTKNKTKNTTMKNNTINWTKTTCDNLDEVAKNLGVELYDALLNKYGRDSNVLYLVQVDAVPTIDNDCYWELAVSPKFAELEAIA